MGSNAPDSVPAVTQAGASTCQPTSELGSVMQSCKLSSRHAALAQQAAAQMLRSIHPGPYPALLATPPHACRLHYGRAPHLSPWRSIRWLQGWMLVWMGIQMCAGTACNIAMPPRRYPSACCQHHTRTHTCAGTPVQASGRANHAQSHQICLLHCLRTLPRTLPAHHTQTMPSNHQAAAPAALKLASAARHSCPRQWPEPKSPRHTTSTQPHSEPARHSSRAGPPLSRQRDGTVHGRGHARYSADLPAFCYCCQPAHFLARVDETSPRRWAAACMPSKWGWISWRAPAGRPCGGWRQGVQVRLCAGGGMQAWGPHSSRR